MTGGDADGITAAGVTDNGIGDGEGLDGGGGSGEANEDCRVMLGVGCALGCGVGRLIDVVEGNADNELRRGATAASVGVDRVRIAALLAARRASTVCTLISDERRT